MEGVPVDVFAQYGILGALVIGFLTGWISPGYLLKREQTENDRLRKLIEERTIPAVEESSAALRASSESLDKALATLQDHQVQMARLELPPGESPSRRH